MKSAEESRTGGEGSGVGEEEKGEKGKGREGGGGVATAREEKWDLLTKRHPFITEHDK